MSVCSSNIHHLHHKIWLLTLPNYRYWSDSTWGEESYSFPSYHSQKWCRHWPVTATCPAWKQHQRVCKGSGCAHGWCWAVDISLYGEMCIKKIEYIKFISNKQRPLVDRIHIKWKHKTANRNLRGLNKQKVIYPILFFFFYKQWTSESIILTLTYYDNLGPPLAFSSDF